MSFKPITSGLTGTAWAELKSDNVIVFAVPGYPYRSVLSQLLYYRLVVIAVFRITSGFPGTPGLHDTSRYLCYVIAKEFGSLEHPSFPQPLFKELRISLKNPLSLKKLKKQGVKNKR